MQRSDRLRRNRIERVRSMVVFGLSLASSLVLFSGPIAFAQNPGSDSSQIEKTSKQVKPSVQGLLEKGYALKWSDEFEGKSLNTDDWTNQKINRVNALGTEEAVTVSDGHLSIRVFNDGEQIKSGFLATDEKLTFKFGFLESRMKLQPKGKSFMGFWLQSHTIGQPIGAPDTAGVEIDVCEYLLQDMSNIDRSKVYRSALHWDGYGKEHQTSSSYAKLPDRLLPIEGQWHTYSVLWTPDKYIFYCDGLETWKADRPISHAMQSLRLSCEVNSPSLRTSKSDFEFGNLADTKTMLQVDWVRVWQRPETDETWHK